MDKIFQSQYLQILLVINVKTHFSPSVFTKTQDFLYTAISLSEQSKNYSVAEKLTYSSFQRLTSQFKKKLKVRADTEKSKGELAQATPWSQHLLSHP